MKRDYITCPCCYNDQTTTIDGLVKEHPAIVPIRNLNQCIAHNVTVAQAYLMVPLYRALIGWEERDDLNAESVRPPP